MQGGERKTWKDTKQHEASCARRTPSNMKQVVQGGERKTWKDTKPRTCSWMLRSYMTTCISMARHVG